MIYLKRKTLHLDKEIYQGPMIGMATLCFFQKYDIIEAGLGKKIVNQLKISSKNLDIDILAFCLMPDHLHLVWMGMRRESNQLNAMRFLRRHMGWLLAPRELQRQAHDHVLRENERKRGAFASSCFYMLANPVRARLVEDLKDWPFGGAIVPGYPTLHPANDGFWELFWKLHTAEREEEPAGPSVPPLQSLE